MPTSLPERRWVVRPESLSHTVAHVLKHDAMNSARRSLWVWLTWRTVAMALVAIAFVTAGMWYRYERAFDSFYSKLPPEVSAELKRLQEAPDEEKYEARIRQIQVQFAHLHEDPSDYDDLLMSVLLSAAVIPFVVLASLRIARRIALPMFEVATAAGAVAAGQFAARAKVLESAPAELQQLTTDFNRMAQRLEAYDHEVRYSSAAIAHELRTPLTAAMVRLQGCVDGVFPLETQQLRMVLNQLDHLHHIVGDLQVLSLSRSGELRLNLSRFSLHDLADERLTWAGAAIHASGKRVRNGVLAAHQVCGDRMRIGQALSAVLDNALRYGDGTITVDSALDGPMVLLRITDQGPGFAPDILDRVFDRFWRADASRARNSGGSGLGLSVVQAICSAHGGAAAATNAPEGGACITLLLPSA